MTGYKVLDIFLCFILVQTAVALDLATNTEILDYHHTSVYIKEKRLSGQQSLPVVLLINSVGLPSVEAFDVPNYSLMELLARAGYDVWGFDFLNQGHSTVTARYPLTQAQALVQLDQVVRHIRHVTQQPTVALLGWSWGTIIAASYAIVHPKSVNHLVLYAAMHGSSLSPMQHSMLIQPNARLPETERVPWEIVQRQWNHMLSDDTRHKNAQTMAWIAAQYCSLQNAEDCTVTRLKTQTIDLMDSWTGKPKYSAQSITVPTLVIYGSGDFFLLILRCLMRSPARHIKNRW